MDMGTQLTGVEAFSALLSVWDSSTDREIYTAFSCSSASILSVSDWCWTESEKRHLLEDNDIHRRMFQFTHCGSPHHINGYHNFAHFVTHFIAILYNELQYFFAHWNKCTEVRGRRAAV